MPPATPGRRSHPIETLRTLLAQTEGLPFADGLTAERLAQALRKAGATGRAAIVTPVLTLWAFLSQIVSSDGSCRAAGARVLAWLVSRGEEPGSPKTDS